MPTATLDELLAALRHSHERLLGAVTPLTDEQLTGQSYDDEWSIAQVLSHVGSGAEVFLLFLNAGLSGEASPGIEDFKPIWDRWNAKTPHDMARDAIPADAGFLERLEALDDAERDRWQLLMFGTEQDLSGVVRMRLSEHALHTWDVAVALDADATVSADAVNVIIDNLETIVGRVGKPADVALDVHVATSTPDRSFRLVLGPDGARLATGGTDGGPALRLPAEAFIRLVYGRLDPAHTPPLETENVDLDALRVAFPGV